MEPGPENVELVSALEPLDRAVHLCNLCRQGLTRFSVFFQQKMLLLQSGAEPG